MPIQSHNPATGETWATFDELTAEQLEQKLALAQKAFDEWKLTDFDHRASLMLKLASTFKKNARHMAELAAKEMGKPIKAGTAEAEKSGWVCEYYAQNAEQFLAQEEVKTDASQSYIRFDPLGVILAVMPWNFPYWQVARFAAPAIMAGNVGLLKHASNVPQCSTAIEQAFKEAGFPDGVFQNLLIGSAKVEQLIKDPRVKAVTLTGSEPAGQQVAKQAGWEIKKTVMELGGSDPFIVLKDADIEKAAQVAAQARLQNCGQSCIAAKRFIVVKDVHDQFLQQFKEACEKMVIGDPLSESTQVGPVVNGKSLQELASQVQRSLDKGAKLVSGGAKKQGPGYFYLPTILAGITKDMPVYSEETFGPVAAVIKAEDTQDAVRIANDTNFGLGSSLWTQDQALAAKLIPQINAGCVFVNGMVKSDPRLPFGGINRSGYGRELSHYGIREFVNVKTVWVA